MGFSSLTRVFVQQIQQEQNTRTVKDTRKPQSACLRTTLRRKSLLLYYFIVTLCEANRDYGKHSLSNPVF